MYDSVYVCTNTLYIGLIGSVTVTYIENWIGNTSLNSNQVFLHSLHNDTLRKGTNPSLPFLVMDKIIEQIRQL